jgi:hypothetical protein
MYALDRPVPKMNDDARGVGGEAVIVRVINLEFPAFKPHRTASRRNRAQLGASSARHVREAPRLRLENSAHHCEISYFI